MIYPHSQIWTPETIRDIHARSDGGYALSGFRPYYDYPTFDELVFLASGLTRFPLEGYKEKSKTKTVLKSRASGEPLAMETPVYVSSSPGYAPGTRSALALGAGLAKTALSVAGRLQPDERKAGRLIYEIPSEAKVPPAPALRAGALQVDVSAGASVESLAALIRALRKGGFKGPCLVAFAAGRVADDTKAAVKAGADAVVLSGLEERPALSVEELSRFNRLPIVAALSQAREALRHAKALGEVQIIAGTGIRNGADAAKALALGADAVAIGESAMIASGLDSAPGVRSAGRAERAVRRDSRVPAERVAKFIASMTMEVALLSRSLGKGDVHSLEFEDLAALSIEASRMTGVRLAGE